MAFPFRELVGAGLQVGFLPLELLQFLLELDAPRLELGTLPFQLRSHLAQLVDILGRLGLGAAGQTLGLGPCPFEHGFGVGPGVPDGLGALARQLCPAGLERRALRLERDVILLEEMAAGVESEAALVELRPLLLQLAAPALQALALLHHLRSTRIGELMGPGVTR